MLQVSELYIYPVKSLGGIAKQTVEIVHTGFKYDRRWMLVDEENRFLTQRVHPQMSLLQPEETADGIAVFHKQQPSQRISIPLTDSGNRISVVVWDDACTAIEATEEINQWFSNMLGFNCKLVYMPDDSLRLVDKRYAENDETTSFSDGYPVLAIGQSSLDLLNEKMPAPLPINRFRPNIVFTGGHAHIEDEMARFTINELEFLGVKPCARCVMTTINQQTAAAGKEPLRTLARYRMKNNKIYFGQNVLPQQHGSISVGDHITIITQQQPFI
ncbi:MOSC domain-containing protein [Ferruginibacter sp.]